MTTLIAATVSRCRVDDVDDGVYVARDFGHLLVFDDFTLLWESGGGIGWFGGFGRF